MSQKSDNKQPPIKLKEFGTWSEVFLHFSIFNIKNFNFQQSSSSGKKYFYNRETEVSQWVRTQKK
jgi:hypothetical protein